jgi:hypothetical protein
VEFENRHGRGRKRYCKNNNEVEIYRQAGVTGTGLWD